MPADGPLVAICMATYEPDPVLLERQIESIRSQSHEHWVCLISDDGSGGARLERLQELVADDPRLRLSHGDGQLGFYLNFERALGLVPAEASFVALADQDDRWYPEKLATLLGACAGARLAYSDMRVVDEGGRVLAPSFWQRRRNNHTDLASLLLANTVTGAASLFPRELLDLALPFPPPLGDAFHDQWIAAIALATGDVAYVDRPLYDYVQHGEAARGHAAAMRGRRAGNLLDWRRPRESLRRVGEYGARSHRTNVRRIALGAREIEARVGPAASADKRRALRRLARLDGRRPPLAWLAARALRPLAGRNETMGMELSLLTAIAARPLAPASARRQGGR